MIKRKGKTKEREAERGGSCGLGPTHETLTMALGEIERVTQTTAKKWKLERQNIV